VLHDDQRIDRGVIGREEACGDRAAGDEHALADPAPEHVERDQTGPVVAAHLEKGTTRDTVDAPRRPDRAGHRRLQHLASLSI
jgi:hypothetical protein